LVIAFSGYYYVVYNTVDVSEEWNEKERTQAEFLNLKENILLELWEKEKFDDLAPLELEEKWKEEIFEEYLKSNYR
jgi:hypothetical protein